MAAKELLAKKGITLESKHHDYSYLYDSVLGIIEQAQKDAYKEAIKDLVILMTDGKGYECSGDSPIEDVILRTLESVKEMNYESI